MLPKRKSVKPGPAQNELTMLCRQLITRFAKSAGNAKLPHSACDKCGYVNPSMTLKLAGEDNS